MVGGGDLKVATVDVETVDNMATLPVGRTHCGSDLTAEKNNVVNKEMELKNVQPKPSKRTSLFIITSFIYAKLLIVICIAYVISDVVTHNLPLYYYEGFFTYLYGMSILFLLYVFCFLLQESSCCTGNPEGAKAKPKKKPIPEKKEKKEKEKEKDKKDPPKKDGKDGKKEKEKEKEEKTKEKDKDKKHKKTIQDIESGVVSKSNRKRKTTQNDSSFGSFFLRVGAIAFGLGTMIYNGLEFGTFFEVPSTSPCYQILRGVNPVLQMIFTFMQMYFIFMNSRLNIQRFKVVARFGLMHVVATNICVWIRTLVLEYLKEITSYLKKNQSIDEGLFGESIKLHVSRNAPADAFQSITSEVPTKTLAAIGTVLSTSATRSTSLLHAMASVAHNISTSVPTTVHSTVRTTTMRSMRTFPTWAAIKTTLSSTLPFITTTKSPTTTQIISSTTPTIATTTTTVAPTVSDITTSSFMTTTTPFFDFENSNNFDSKFVEDAAHSIIHDRSNSILDNTANSLFGDASNSLFESNNLSVILPQALISNETETLAANCGRVNIMGTIVQDSAPYLFPFIIEYSLIGAAVIYVMWKHIGRIPSRVVTEEDLEHRLEVMLSRRAVAMAHAQNGRVDCVGSSKGLFFGLLLLVGSLICLILFFVLIHHPDLNILAIYLADASHCVLMVLSIIAITIGFIRVQGLKFRTEEQSDLNDILLRVSAFGLFIYAVFSVIAGSVGAFSHEPHLLVMVTSLLSIIQVVLQLLFISDVSRRRVYLPEHDRSKPGRQVVTFLLICNVTMWIIYTFEMKKVEEDPVQLNFYGFLAWAIVQRITLPLCIFHRFHSAVTFAEIWKTSYKARLE